MTTAETGTGTTASSLNDIFHPRSVAIAGVSTLQPGFAGVGMGFLLSLMELRFPAVYPVNPKYQEIEGLRCYASVLDIDGPVDHVISSVPARIVPQLAEDCIAKGVRSVHFFTAGFRETGDDEMADLETQVVGRLTGSGIRVFGPNCRGLYVPESKLAFMPGFPAEVGPVGFISQSGGNAGEMVYTAAVRGIRFSKVVSYGNASDIDESELLSYLAADPQTDVICACIERVTDGRRFFEAMGEAAGVKPVVVLKGGRTASGTRAVMSHTARLAGSLAVFDSLCAQVNAVRVDSVDVILYHTSFSWGRGRRSMAMLGADPVHYMQMQVQQMVKAREASGTPIVVVLRPPLDVESMERTAAFQEKCWQAGFPVFPTIPRAANTIAKVLRWARGRSV